MPLYEYQCAECGQSQTELCSFSDAPAAVICEACAGQAVRIISRPAVHLSRLSKVEKLDPKYDAMADRALRSDPKADPDFYLKRSRSLDTSSD